VGSPSTPNGKGIKHPASEPAPEPRPEVEPDLLENEAPTSAQPEDGDEPGQTSLPARSLKLLADAGSKFPLNSADPRASNRELRAREAEEDRALIAQAQSGDPNSPTDTAVRSRAFRKLVDRHQRRAFAIAVGLVRDENDAREIVQEAFLRVYRGLSTFEGGSSFFTWLYRIVTNLAIDLMRKPGRRAAELDETRGVGEEAESDFALVSRIDGADPIDVVRRKEMAARIQSALDALPSYHRAVILMREIDGLSYEEMAEAMGVSKGTIMSRLFHARQKMQKALADVYAELNSSGGAQTPGPNSQPSSQPASDPARNKVALTKES